MHVVLIAILVVLVVELFRGRKTYFIVDSQTGRVRGVEKRGLGCLGTIVMILLIMYLLRHF